MSEIIIDGKVYKEVTIGKLIVDGTVVNGYVITPEQMAGKDKLQITIETEPTE